MAYISQPGVSDDAPRIQLTRRAIVKGACTIGLSWTGIGASGTPGALAAPAVTVGPPTIVRTAECLATVSVLVTIASDRSGARYEAFGDLLEWDEADGEPDMCCALVPRSTRVAGQETSILLEGHASAADLGLVKGIGPASDEAFSPDLVELFARIWPRDLAANDRYGPWDSLQRAAVARDTRAWKAGRFPGSEFLATGGRGLYRAGDPVGMPLPPRECVP